MHGAVARVSLDIQADVILTRKSEPVYSKTPCQALFGQGEDVMTKQYLQLAQNAIIHSISLKAQVDLTRSP